MKQSFLKAIRFRIPTWIFGTSNNNVIPTQNSILYNIVVGVQYYIFITSIEYFAFNRFIITI